MGDDLDDFIDAWQAEPPGRGMLHMHFPAAEKLDAVNREIAMRRNVYRKRVAAGRMKKAEADREIRIMEAIAADYEREAEQEIAIGEE
jgi:hypothetical protein